MTARWIAATVAVLILAGLLIWQQQRLTLVDACHAAGGWWDGNRSRCRQVPPSIIIERNLKRSSPNDGPSRDAAGCDVIMTSRVHARTVHTRT